MIDLLFCSDLKATEPVKENETNSSLSGIIKCALAYLCPDFIELRSINFLRKSVASAGGFNFIQPGFEPPLNGIPICIHLTTYRSGRFLLDEVKERISHSFQANISV